MVPSILILLSVLFRPFGGHAQTPFYKDKTIRLVAGTPAGSVYDLYARMVAQFIGKYIPGNPNVIVQNMPGVASMVAANYIYTVAKPDGLTIGSIQPALYFDQLVGRKEVQFDWKKFTWIGNTTVSALSALHAQRYAIQNHRRYPQSRRAAQMRRRRDRVRRPTTCPDCWKKPSARSSPSSPATTPAPMSTWRWSAAKCNAAPLPSLPSSPESPSPLGARKVLSMSSYRPAKNATLSCQTRRRFQNSWTDIRPPNRTAVWPR